MKRRRSAPFTVSIAVLSALLAACGDGDSGKRNGSDAGPDGSTDGGLDGAPDGGEEPPPPIGDPCTAEAGCEGGVCLGWLPGGYCSMDACGPDDPCPDGSLCAPVRSGGVEQNVCLKTCDMLDDCRVGEGYVCERDATCWPATDDPPPHRVGGACTVNSDCYSPATCLLEYYGDRPSGNTAGNCAVPSCAGGCPVGTTCSGLLGGSRCLASCRAESDCRPGYKCHETGVCHPACDSNATCPDKHLCIGGWCLESRYACSVTNTAGWCPGAGRCVRAACTEAELDCAADPVLEPNDTMEQAAPLDLRRTFDLKVCTADEDWYGLDVAAGELTEVKLVFRDQVGNLDMVAYDESGEFVQALWTTYPHEGLLVSDFDVSGETLTFFSPSADRTYFLRILGSSGAVNTYGLVVRRYPYSDGTVCEDSFSAEECSGRPGGVKKLYQFPIPDPDDPYGAPGYFFQTVSSYYWARRELIMIVRDAIRQTLEAYPGTSPLAMTDASQEDILTPGYDIGDPRHCETCHDQGSNVDLAYYQVGGDNRIRTVCGPGGSNVTGDGLQCTADARNEHLVDLDRQVFLMAKLFESPRMRAMGVDPILAEPIRARATEMRGEGTISVAGYNGIMTRLGLWPTHHNHIHVSMNWW